MLDRYVAYIGVTAWEKQKWYIAGIVIAGILLITIILMV